MELPSVRPEPRAVPTKFIRTVVPTKLVRTGLVYEPLDDNWGLDVLGMKELEEKELARIRFLGSGPGDCRIGEGKRQTTIKVWSAIEKLSRE